MKKHPFAPFVKSKTETRSWSEIVASLRDHSGERLVIIKRTEVLKMPENTSLLWSRLFEYANDVNEKRAFLLTDPSALDQFWNNVKGKTLTPTDVDQWFRAVGIRRGICKTSVIKLLIRAGMLTKEKVGRRVKYHFSDIDIPEPPKVDDTVVIKDMKIVKRHDPITGAVKVLVTEDNDNSSSCCLIVDGLDISPEV